ncbi:glycopeptide [Macrolepiota fuliginosa MF-IS2]|uniref:Glycopeptide n=1 Tax=Macrolepiota fuliginosa MF-IS2 TaxID=1400762 RepID=A0A9P6BZX2_9AGAR|nr:glycopeptide [Macrolepiota fuliginosa MF-IS2]
MFTSPRFLAFGTAALAVVAIVKAETHTVIFDNRCGFGTPTLIQGGQVLSTGGAFTSNGPLTAAIAYLQTGSCGFNGEGCTLVETTLINPTTPGSGSSTDLSLIPPHAFSVTSGFGYFNGCDNTGADCTDAGCLTAFHTPDQTGVQVACQTNDVNLAITFCD